MKKIIISMMVLILFTFNFVFAVAPEDPIVEPLYPVHIRDLVPVEVSFYVIDTDNLTLSCSLYYSNSSNFTAVPNYLIDPQLSNTDESVLNNSITSIYLDIRGYQDEKDDQTIYYQINCSDGTDSSGSLIRNVRAYPLFAYTEDDISLSIMETIIKGLIAVIALVAIVTFTMIGIWGWKALNKPLK